MQDKIMEQFYQGQQPIVHEHHYEVITGLPEIVTAKLFETHFGISPAAVSGKITSKAWTEGKEFLYDPQGRIHVILEGYYSWLKSGRSKHKLIAKESELEVDELASTSDGKVSAIGNKRTETRPKQGSKPRPIFEEKL